MKLRNAILSILSISLFGLAAGCTKAPVPDDVIRVGTISGPETVLVEKAKEIALEKYGLKVEIKQFEDYMTPNSALHDGSIDVNVYQHLPYLERATQTRGYDFVSVGRTFIFPMGIYSQRYKAMDKLPDGALIGIPSDPSNEERALLLFEAAGLIELDHSSKVEGLHSIKGNPHKFKFKEMGSAQLPRALQDLDAAAINSTFVTSAGMDLDSAIFIESNDSPYANVIVSTPALSQTDKVNHFVDSLQSSEVENTADRLFEGAAIKAW